MSCGICGEHRKLMCGPCAGHLVLRSRINLVKSMDQLDEVQAAVAATLKDPRTGALEATLASLEAQLARTRAETQRYRKQTLAVLEEAKNQTTQLMAVRTELRQRENTVSHEVNASRQTLDAGVKGLERKYKNNLHQSMSYQSQCLKDLLAIFAVRRRRRKHGQPPDTLLGFGIVPDAGLILQYSPASINSGLERVALFTALCAGYLSVQLPFNIFMPSSTSVDARMQHAAESHPLRVTRTVRELLRSDPAEFYLFCRAFAMLIIDVASLAARIGVPKLEVADVVKLNELVTQIVLRIASQVHANVEIQVQSAGHQLDLDVVQDFLITQAEVGAHAGWSVVDAQEL